MLSHDEQAQLQKLERLLSETDGDFVTAFEAGASQLPSQQRATTTSDSTLPTPHVRTWVCIAALTVLLGVFVHPLAALVSASAVGMYVSLTVGTPGSPEHWYPPF